MARRILPLLIVLCVGYLSACRNATGALGLGASSELSTSRAQSAVEVAMRQRFNNWAASKGVAQVQGVQMNVDGAGAVADIAFSNISLTCQPGFATQHENWQRGTAVFKHYTDGRWVLTDVHVEGEAFHLCGGGWVGSIPVN